MNNEEQHFVSELCEHFGNLMTGSDADTVLVEHDLFTFRFSIKDMRLTIHSVRVPQEGQGIGGEIVCFVQEFAERNLIFEIIAVSVVDSAFTFWEEAGFSANGDSYYYDV